MPNEVIRQDAAGAVSSQERMRAAVDKLQEMMLQLPQAELPTTHMRADGMYARIVERAAGTLIVGKVHKKEHFYIVTRGRIRVTTDDGVQTLCAGSVVVSRPGTKRAVLALEDSICMTVHRLSRPDLTMEEIEQELVEPDPLSPFDFMNRLKVPQIEGA